MAYFPSTNSRHRGRSYSLSQPTQMAGSYPYPTTPYSGYGQLAPTYYDNPGYNPSQTFFVAPSASGRSRSRSRSRPAHSHHGHGHTGRRSRSHHRGHGHQRRSHSTTSHRHQRPSHHHSSRQPPQTRITYPRQSHHSPTIGERIRSFFGLGSSPRYVDQYGRNVDNRGRTLQKY